MLRPGCTARLPHCSAWHVHASRLNPSTLSAAPPQVLANLQALLSDLFIPLVAALPARQSAESAKDEFIQVLLGGTRWSSCWLVLESGKVSLRPARSPLALPAPAQGATKFAAALGEAAAGAGGGVELPLPEQQFLAAVVGHRAGSAKSLTKAAANPELVAAFEAALTGWCDSVEAALRSSTLEGKDGEDAGAAGVV